ncbi:MAG: Dabb family protein [Anaerolineaceae bacterium]|nr:MAG: Dabb family protein [Anaerolineaceae bacterium]
MVRHIVAWDFREEFSDDENKMYGEEIKKELENLKNLIDGIVSIEVLTNAMFSSDADILLDSVFADEDAYKAYQTHPEHVRVGTYVVRPRTCNRKCFDYYLD